MKKFLFLILLAGLLMSVSDNAEAKSDKRDRIRFYGWVEAMPEGLHGVWVIGGRSVVTSPRTQFDQMEGPLRIGGCAKVDIRAGMVHEIDSEPDSDCRGR